MNSHENKSHEKSSEDLALDSHEDLDDAPFANTPNLLTLTRILLTPLVVGALMMKTPVWDTIGAIIFGIAGITDYFDGYFARRDRIESIYGKLMDPLADKFLVVSSLIVLQELGRIHFIIVILLVCRELAITGLRALASAEGVIIPASRTAKWKTGFQMTAIPLLMLINGMFGISYLGGETTLGIPVDFYVLGTFFAFLSLAISLWSAKDYIFGFLHGVNERRRQRRLQKRNLS